MGVCAAPVCPVVSARVALCWRGLFANSSRGRGRGTHPFEMKIPMYLWLEMVGQTSPETPTAVWPLGILHSGRAQKSISSTYKIPYFFFVPMFRLVACGW